MTEKFSQNAKKPLRQTTISRYTPFVDNYAKAPLRRLFHFVSVSLRIDTTRNYLIRQGLHTLISRTNTSPALSIGSTHFQKPRGVYPTHFESPVPSSWRRPDPRHRVAAIASPIAGLSTGSCCDRSAHAAETSLHPRKRRHRPPSIFTCKKKAIYPTLTGNAAATGDVYIVIPTTRINLQETDR